MFVPSLNTHLIFSIDTKQNNKNNALIYKQKDIIGLLKCNKNLMVENVD